MVTTTPTIPDLFVSFHLALRRGNSMRTTDAEAESLFAQADRALRLMAATRSRGPADVALKIRAVACDSRTGATPNCKRLSRSVLHDLDRLAAQ